MDLSTERLSNENFDFILTKDNELDENLKKIWQPKVGEKCSTQTRYRKILQFSSTCNFHLEDTIQRLDGQTFLFFVLPLVSVKIIISVNIL